MADDSISSGAKQNPEWLRVVMPSAVDLIFVGILCALAFTVLSQRLLGDAGIGWHIRTGRQILAAHAIPRTDPFSSTMSGKPWFAWEWLYDVIVGWLDAHIGLNGVVWFTAVIIAATFAWTFRILIARGANLIVAVGLTLLVISASMIHFFARPHVVSWIFTLAFFRILDSAERDGIDARRSRWLWALPLLMLVWVNVHGGFLIGFVLLAIFFLSAVWTWFRSNEGRIEEALQKIEAGKRARRLLVLGVLSFVASVVNPYGWRLYSHVYGYLSNRFLMDHIDEFRSPNFHGIAQKCFLALLLITVAILAQRARRLQISHILIILFAVYAGLYASRNIPVSSILLALVVGPLVPASAFFRDFSQRMAAVELRSRGHLWPVVATLATLAIAANGGRVGSSTWMNARFDPKRMPVAAVDYIEKQGVARPILSEDYWGGYLIYRLYPRSKVVLDDRHDLYGEEFFRSYLKMVQVERGWQEFLQKHPAGCVLLPRNSGLASVLEATNEWREAYADDVAVVLERRP